MDVIVSSVGHTLVAGACAKALMVTGGAAFLRELQRHGKIEEGSLIATGSGDLRCEEVYHCRMAKWNGVSTGEVNIYSSIYCSNNNNSSSSNNNNAT